MENNLYVEWTGSYPCLCHGEWIIKYNDIELNIPEDKKHNHMNTINEYDYWRFNEDWGEEWVTYTDGLYKNKWILHNLDWITEMFNEEDIEVTEELLSELFDKIQKEDWRHNSCGGCI